MLNRTTSWKDIKEAIARDDQGKKDYTVPIANVRMNNETGRMFNNLVSDPNLQLGNVPEGLLPNDHALGQLFGRCGMDTRYFRRAYGKDPYLAAEHVNYWIETGDMPGAKDGEPEVREWLIRSKNETMRAVLTDKYGQLDNNFAFDALSTVLNDGDAVRNEGFMLDDKYLNARMVFPEMQVNIGTIQKPDNVFVGAHFMNSEVGSSSVRIEACLFRQVCSNGMIVRIDGEILLKQRHSHISRNELQNRVAEAVGKAIKAGDHTIEMFAKSREIKVESPLELIAKLAKGEKYSQKTADMIVNSYNSEPMKNAYGIINAFTHAAQNLAISERLEMEVFAGNWMQEIQKETVVGV